MSENERRIKEKFLDMMELPKELLKDVSRITLLGNEDILVENYKGIIEYEENIIRLNNGINVFGTNLNVEEITEADIFITGKINNVEFEN